MIDDIIIAAGGVSEKPEIIHGLSQLMIGKNISLAETNSEPSLLESFLIDEKKITLKLLLSRLLQRLNAQKWLLDN